jgi:hypothetical protein
MDEISNWRAFRYPDKMFYSVRVAAGSRVTHADLGSLLVTGPFHLALRAAIRERGLPLERLRVRLAERGIPVGLSSLSNWQHGQSRPERANSLRAVRALEEILGVPPAALSRLLLHADEGLDEQDGPLGELLDTVPGSRVRDFDVLTRQQKIVVNADRQAPLVRTRTLVRARRDGVDRYIVRFFGDPGCAIDRVVVRAGENCRLGAVHRHPHAPVLVAELLFGTVLHAGDTWFFEDMLWEPTNAPECVEHGHGFRTAVGQFLLQVRFHPDALPVRCHAYASAGLDEPPRPIADLVLSARHEVHLVASNVASGVRGIAWDWP